LKKDLANILTNNIHLFMVVMAVWSILWPH
jgi:hypothetical protein